MTIHQPAVYLPIDYADIVDRLRAYDPDTSPADWIDDAVDEIVRLRRRVAELEAAPLLDGGR